MIQLLQVRTDRLGYEQIANLAASTKDLNFGRLEIDFSQCSFFEANMAAVLGAVLARVTDNLNKVEIANLPRSIETILRKNRFLVQYGFSPLDDSNQTTLPFRRLKMSDGSLFADYLDQYLRGRGIPPMSPGLTRAFKQSIFEIFHNSVYHSHSRLGVFACGQFFPNKKRLDLTIADAGVGIRTNVRDHLKNNKISSVGAIRWALDEGNTTRTGKLPGGIGLKLLKEFTKNNGGRIQIASRYGFYEYDGGNEKFGKLAADLPGTSVNLEVNTADTSEYSLLSEVSADDIFF